jgi:hypothetical protein
LRVGRKDGLTDASRGSDIVARREQVEGKTMWIKCTLIESGKVIRVNMALAATFVPHGAGTRIWIPGDQIGIDVTELPEQIDAALAGGAVDDQSS